MRLWVSISRAILLSTVILVFSITIKSQSNSLIDVPGQVAFIGLDYNIYSLQVQDSEAVALTTARLRKLMVWRLNPI